MSSRNHLTSAQKEQFCRELSQAQASFAVVCRAFRIARQTGYKWWRRYQASGVGELIVRARSGFKSVYGPDSTQYQQAGGTRKSDRKRPVRRAQTEVKSAA